jgi:DNA-binding HxlR family transcriptional regulator
MWAVPYHSESPPQWGWVGLAAIGLIPDRSHLAAQVGSPSCVVRDLDAISHHRGRQWATSTTSRTNRESLASKGLRPASTKTTSNRWPGSWPGPGHPRRPCPVKTSAPPWTAHPNTTGEVGHGVGRAWGLAMNVNDYLEVRDLFSTKWDPAVLAALGNGPCRYLCLVRQARRHIHTEIPDKTVTRSLDRLQELGYVKATEMPDGERTVSVYELTREGRLALAAYRAILTAYEQARPPHGRVIPLRR